MLLLSLGQSTKTRAPKPECQNHSTVIIANAVAPKNSKLKFVALIFLRFGALDTALRTTNDCFVNQFAMNQTASEQFATKITENLNETRMKSKDNI